MKVSGLLAVFNILAVLVFLAILVLHPIPLDTHHMDDTVFLAHVGWRGVNGLTPVLDYPSYYGGMTERFMTWAFQLFGVSYRSINYGIAMMFAPGAAMLWILGWRRLSTTRLTLLIAVSAALVLSLSPIELGRVDWPRVAHSYVYNHVGIVLMMALTIFSLERATPRPLEVATALLAGVVVFALMLLKSTFGVVGPFVVLACLLQGRWLSTVSVVAGTILGMLLMDPGLQRVLGSLDYLLTSVDAADGLGLTFVIGTGIKIVFQQILALSVVLLLMFLIWRRFGRRELPFLLSVVSLACGYGAALITTSGEPDLKFLPFLIVIALISAARIEAGAALSSKSPPAAANDTGQAADDTSLSLARALPFAMAYALIVPALLSAAAGLVLASANRGASLIEAGPAKDYVVLSGDIWPPLRDASLPADVARFNRDPEQLHEERVEYVMFADGIALLQAIPEMAEYGIISNGRMFDFTAPLMAPPVASFPLWPTENLKFFSDPGPLPMDVDAVMMSLDIPELGLVNRQLAIKMGDDFRVCQTSKIWTLYLRNSIPGTFCSPM